MSAYPKKPRESSWSFRALRLNFREVLPIRSVRHPGNLSAVPSDAICVLWLDSEGVGSDSRFAYLNYSRAAALHRELGLILSGKGGDGSVERARRMLRGVDVGEVSGA